MPQWFELVARHAGPERALILSVTDDASAGLVCLRSADGHDLGSCTNLYTCAFDALARGTGGGEMRAFAKSFVSVLRPGGVIHLRGIDSGSAHLGALIAGLRDGGLVVKSHFDWGTWFERTEGTDFGRYLSARPSMLRNTWKRKGALLLRSAKAKFRLYRRGEGIESYLAAYESVRERSWKDQEPIPSFIPQLVGVAAGLGALRFGVLDVDGAPAAAQFWIVWEGKATIYKLVYADALARFSPGTLLTMHMLESVLEEDRPVEIDFGRGDDAYKKLWLSSRREHWGIEAVSPYTPRGLVRAVRLGAALGRDYANAKLRRGRAERSNGRKLP